MARIGDTGEFTPSVLAPGSGSEFLGTLPSAPCGDEIQFYFQAETFAGTLATFPADAPQSLFTATASHVQTTASSRSV
jgi:hypothetical protein